MTKDFAKKKVLKFSEKRKKEIMQNYLSMYPEELAYYFTISVINERALINESLKKAPRQKIEKVRYYIAHPLELNEKLSHLEQKTK